MAAARNKGAVQEEIIPLKCYACGQYDGKFGPKSDEFTHVCETCSALPTEETGPIDTHVQQYNKGIGTYGEELLRCDTCGYERDECSCTTNPLRHRQTALDTTLAPRLYIDPERRRILDTTRAPRTFDDGALQFEYHTYQAATTQRPIITEAELEHIQADFEIQRLEAQEDPQEGDTVPVEREQ